MEPFPITPRQFVWLWLATLVATFVTAFFLRRAQGLPFFRPEFPASAVQQTWISGASSRGLLGRFARSNNCLWFALTNDTLYVGAHFPFNLFMPRFLAQLDLTIPIATISSVTEKSSLFGGGLVRIAYDANDGTRGIAREEYVDLYPRRGDHFVDILNDRVRAAHKPRAL
jgi:hypothetical protein